MDKKQWSPFFCSKKIWKDESGSNFNNIYVQVFLDCDIFIIRDQMKTWNLAQI